MRRGLSQLRSPQASTEEVADFRFERKGCVGHQHLGAGNIHDTPKCKESLTAAGGLHQDPSRTIGEGVGTESYIPLFGMGLA